MVIRKTDANHKEIMEQCRQIPNLSVFSTHTIGKGFPDIVVGYKGKNYLFEIKNKKKTKSQKKLTPDEEKFHFTWNGQINIVESIFDIINLIGR